MVFEEQNLAHSKENENHRGSVMHKAAAAETIDLYDDEDPTMIPDTQTPERRDTPLHSNDTKTFNSNISFPRQEWDNLVGTIENLKSTVNLLKTQNEALTKKIDQLQSENSNSLKSGTTPVRNRRIAASAGVATPSIYPSSGWDGSRSPPES